MESVKPELLTNMLGCVFNGSHKQYSFMSSTKKDSSDWSCKDTDDINCLLVIKFWQESVCDFHSWTEINPFPEVSFLFLWGLESGSSFIIESSKNDKIQEINPCGTLVIIKFWETCLGNKWLIWFVRSFLEREKSLDKVSATLFLSPFFICSEKLENSILTMN